MNGKLIGKIDLSENVYTTNNESFDVATLIQFCKDKKYKEVEVPLEAFNLNTFPWNLKNLSDIIGHINRVMKADLKYPIILDWDGCIADGYHRLVKAFISGQKTIKVIRMLDKPFPSGKTDV